MPADALSSAHRSEQNSVGVLLAASRNTASRRRASETRAKHRENDRSYVGKGEAEVASLLVARGYGVTMQKAVGPYNIDIAWHHIAIEIHNTIGERE